jgi:hypothetical protein
MFNELGMTPFPPFAAAAGPWQAFYLLVGTAAATLVGLMFVAVTFGSSLVTPQTSASARAFLDPTFTHFVHVLVTSCLIVIPTMGWTLLGALLLMVGALRTAALVGVYRHMREAQRVNQDIELSDWVTGVALPLLCYLALCAIGAAFVARVTAAFNALAIVTITILLTGVFGAWELMVWMAVARSRLKEPTSRP